MKLKSSYLVIMNVTLTTLESGSMGSPMRERLLSTSSYMSGTIAVLTDTSHERFVRADSFHVLAHWRSHGRTELARLIGALAHVRTRFTCRKYEAHNGMNSRLTGTRGVMLGRADVRRLKARVGGADE